MTQEEFTNEIFDRHTELCVMGVEGLDLDAVME